MKLTRSYQLKIYSNFYKQEDLRYSASRYRLYLQHFITQLFYRPWLKHLSTKGVGTLANQAQREAIGIVRSARATDQKDCPKIQFDSCPGVITENEESKKFDYWVKLNSQWKNRVQIPACSHRKLNDKLKKDWKLSDHCEFFRAQNGNWYLRVFVTKEVKKPEPTNRFLGVDVGIKHSIARSDGYLGSSLSPIIKSEKQKQASRQINHHPKKPFKTSVKQLLDHEVNLALGRSKRDSLNLVVEHPKTLANLRSGKLQGWARSYFANRLSQGAKEEDASVIWVNPKNTSIRCSECGLIDKRSRVNQSEFECTGCGNTVNADLNAAFNIALKGQERLRSIAAKTPVTIFQIGG